MHRSLVLLATTGMRRGEVLGLRWSDVDLDAGQLAVVQTLTSVNGHAVVGPTKTVRSRRTAISTPTRSTRCANIASGGHGATT